MKKYIPAEIESKWQKKWAKDKLFSPDMDLPAGRQGKVAQPYYSLMMFPYPSAEGLHVGNMYAFTGSDIFSRFKRMQGFDVFEPIGLDGFGIHSENYALKINQHPMDLSKVTEARFYKQLHIIGNSYDWERTVETYKPNYYKWTQWLFLQMFKKGLAYRKKASVNWCPKDLTVLADEQVINGECERCASKVEQKLLEQWFFRITDYADRLLGNLEKLDWSNKVKIAQKDWIGKSEGILIRFPFVIANEVKQSSLGDSSMQIASSKTPRNDGFLEVFTTALDTIFGVTFMVISPENLLLGNFVNAKQRKVVDEYIAVAKEKPESERTNNKEKTGVFTGGYVTNPFNDQKIPVWVADYVLAGYGTGAVMGVPGHDARDHEFAQKFGLKIKAVIKPKKGVEGAEIGKDGFWDYSAEVKSKFPDNSELFDSGEYSGLTSKEAKKKMSKDIEDINLGKRQVNYHLRDWLISRQRYWGPPIPIVYCDKCGTVPVPEEDLPVELPFVKEFRPSGTGKSPLALVESFYKVKCPNCGAAAKRETDVSDTFLDSAWYFLRYPSTEFADQPFNTSRTKNWLPVNMYIGGAEHSVLHLLYSRFVTMVLNDLKFIDFEEPFTTFRAHGLIIKDGAKMSKSKGNIVNPDDYIKEYGADVLRTYLMFVGPFADGGDFRDSSLNGIYKFLQRVWGLQDKVTGDSGQVTGEDLRVMHKTIKKITEDLAELKYNTAIASLMEWLNHLSRKVQISVEEYRTFLMLLAPFAPHITEELWEIVKLSDETSLKAESEAILKTDNWSIHQHSWPEFDNKYLQEEQISIVVQINGKVRDVLLIQKDILDHKEVVEKMAKESVKVQKSLAGGSVKKVVYVPWKIINLVV